MANPPLIPLPEPPLQGSEREAQQPRLIPSLDQLTVAGLVDRIRAICPGLCH